MGRRQPECRRGGAVFGNGRGREIEPVHQLGEKNWFYKGCDINGMPLDPNHPWNRERNSKA